ncbi:hypothetical protein HY945_02925 [Candidatus Gottesmanbacteria bacterium]|nr:hypothetical protein [Candidatus Gottesmanbacteria bacterium]
MLILIHGDDIVSSRKALEEHKLKEKGVEIINFDGNVLDLPSFVTAADSQSLFGEGKLIIIENLLGSSLTKQKEKILDFLNSSELSQKVILWEKGEIGKTAINKYCPKGKVILCQPPLLLFRFIDSLGDHNERVLTLYHALLAQREPELVLAMLFRQLRLLIIAESMGEKGLKAQASWQAHKFIKQANLFGKEQLYRAYRSLLLIDYNVKTGQTPYNLSQLLDIFLINL